MIRVILTIDHKSCNNGVTLLPFLERLSQAGFPPPCTLAKSAIQGWRSYAIGSFIDKKAVRFFRPNLTGRKTVSVSIDNASEKQLNVNLLSKRDGSTNIMLNNIAPFLEKRQLKSFFLELIQSLNYWHAGNCDIIPHEIYSKHFSYEELRTKTRLSWLRYYSKDALEEIGGFAAFESNPYLQTERIHDGLLVQVGDDPAIFDTPEGEQLLVNAINALPLMQS